MSFLFVEPRAAYSFLQTFPHEFALAVRLMVPLIDHSLVHPRQRIEFMGESKHHMKIRNGKEF